MNDKRAKDIMTTDVIVANKNDIIANVANLLKGDKDGSVEDMKKAIELAPENEMNISGQYNNYENMTKNVPF